ncbi:TPA: hypothetical protein ACSUN1_000571 [Salmonella enterica subsp. diarizonae]
MELSAFPVIRVILGLVCLIPGMSSATTAEATYNLSARVGSATCKPSLMTDNGTDIDFGLLAVATGNKEEKVVTLKLDCTNSALLPDKVGLEFSTENGDVPPDYPDRLYPRAPGGATTQKAFYYALAWDEGIQNVVTDLAPGTAIGINSISSIHSAGPYALNQSPGRTTWDFPLRITRIMSSSPVAGDYVTSVTVKISYQ